MYRRQLGTGFWINRWLCHTADLNLLGNMPAWEPREIDRAQTGLSPAKTPLICFDLTPASACRLYPMCPPSSKIFCIELQMTFPLTQCDRPWLFHIPMHHPWAPLEHKKALVLSTGLLFPLYSLFPLPLYPHEHWAFKESDVPLPRACLHCFNTEMVCMPGGIAYTLDPKGVGQVVRESICLFNWCM